MNTPISPKDLEQALPIQTSKLLNLNNLEKTVLAVSILFCAIISVLHFIRKSYTDVTSLQTKPPQSPKPQKKTSYTPSPPQSNVRIKSLGHNGCLIRNIDINFQDLFELFKQQSSPDDTVKAMGVVIIDLKTKKARVVNRDGLESAAPGDQNYQDMLTSTARKLNEYIKKTLLKENINNGDDTLIIDFTITRRREQISSLHQDMVTKKITRQLIANKQELGNNQRWLENRTYNDALFFVYDQGEGAILPTFAIEDPKSPKTTISEKRKLFREQLERNTIDLTKSNAYYLPLDARPLTDLYGFNNRNTLHAAPNKNIVSSLIGEDAALDFFQEDGDYRESLKARGFIRFAVSSFQAHPQ